MINERMVSWPAGLVKIFDGSAVSNQISGCWLVSSQSMSYGHKCIESDWNVLTYRCRILKQLVSLCKIT